MLHGLQDNIGDSTNEEEEEGISTIGLKGGSRLSRGRTLDGEIDRYKRRVEALNHFLDRMAPQWWDRMYLFEGNGELVKRPSRSADMLRTTQSRLMARLARLTPRVIVCAASAVISIEEAEKVSVLPSCFIRNHTWPRTTEVGRANREEQLAMAFALARRLGEIERLKQQVILHAIDWITADSNDMKVRLQRMESLARRVQPCLIENHEGVSAVIRHYFRRRSKPKAEEKMRAFVDPLSEAKRRLKHAFSAITADDVCCTNQAIVEILARNHEESFLVGCREDGGRGKVNEMLSKEVLEHAIGRSTEEVNRWIRCLTDDMDSILYPLSGSGEFAKSVYQRLGGKEAGGTGWEDEGDEAECKGDLGNWAVGSQVGDLMPWSDGQESVRELGATRDDMKTSNLHRALGKQDGLSGDQTLTNGKKWKPRGMSALGDSWVSTWDNSDIRVDVGQRWK